MRPCRFRMRSTTSPPTWKLTFRISTNVGAVSGAATLGLLDPWPACTLAELETPASASTATSPDPAKRVSICLRTRLHLHSYDGEPGRAHMRHSAAELARSQAWQIQVQESCRSVQLVTQFLTFAALVEDRRIPV